MFVHFCFAPCHFHGIQDKEMRKMHIYQMINGAIGDFRGFYLDCSKSTNIIAKETRVCSFSRLGPHYAVNQSGLLFIEAPDRNSEPHHAQSLNLNSGLDAVGLNAQSAPPQPLVTT